MVVDELVSVKEIVTDASTSVKCMLSYAYYMTMYNISFRG